MSATSSAPAGWLAGLGPDSLGDFELTPEIDADLSRRAIAAQHDPAERDHLFRLLAFKLHRYCQRFNRWILDPFEYDDVLQEAYLVFVDLLPAWRHLDAVSGWTPPNPAPRSALSGGSREPAGFGYYVADIFPLRLADRVNRLIHTRRDRQMPVPWAPATDVRPDPDTLEDDVAVEMLITAICGRLNAVDATIFRLRVTTPQSPDQIAQQANLSRSGYYRRWGEIVRIAREELEAS